MKGDRMTTRERMLRTLRHEEADRVPVLDVPWGGTLRRWVREGMPAGMDWRDYFGVDKTTIVTADISPRYAREVLEETERYVIFKNEWGVTMKQLKQEDATPEFLDYRICDSALWKEAKRRMQPDPARIDWNTLRNNYKTWKSEGQWLQLGFWFGFDVTHSWFCGLETVLVAMLEEPEWLQDMFGTFLDMSIAHAEMILDAGYEFDAVNWPDDMGYKGTAFFSETLYKELLQPFHRRAVEWAHAHGMAAQLHSCGNIMKLMPYIADTGVDVLNPLEIKAGMDALQLKRDYGQRLTFHGGINAQLWGDEEKVIAEIKNYLPALKRGGGYIFASDHSIPNDTSLHTMSQIIKTVEEIGSCGR